MIKIYCHIFYRFWIKYYQMNSLVAFDIL